MHRAPVFAYGPKSNVHLRQRTSQELLSLIKEQRKITDSKRVFKMRRQLPRQLTVSFEAKEMKLAAPSSNGQKLFKLTRDTGGR